MSLMKKMAKLIQQDIKKKAAYGIDIVRTWDDDLVTKEEIEDEINWLKEQQVKISEDEKEEFDNNGTNVREEKKDSLQQSLREWFQKSHELLEERIQKLQEKLKQID